MGKLLLAFNGFVGWCEGSQVRVGAKICGVEACAQQGKRIPRGVSWNSFRVFLARPPLSIEVNAPPPHSHGELP